MPPFPEIWGGYEYYNSIMTLTNAIRNDYGGVVEEALEFYSSIVLNKTDRS